MTYNLMRAQRLGLGLQLDDIPTDAIHRVGLNEAGNLGSWILGSKARQVTQETERQFGSNIFATLAKVKVLASSQMDTIQGGMSIYGPMLVIGRPKGFDDEARSVGGRIGLFEGFQINNGEAALRVNRLVRFAIAMSHIILIDNEYPEQFGQIKPNERKDIEAIIAKMIMGSTLLLESGLNIPIESRKYWRDYIEHGGAIR